MTDRHARRINEVAADTMDLDVFRLISKCHGHADNKATTKLDREKWNAAARALTTARTHLRAMLGPQINTARAGDE